MDYFLFIIIIIIIIIISFLGYSKIMCLQREVKDLKNKYLPILRHLDDAYYREMKKRIRAELNLKNVLKKS